MKHIMFAICLLSSTMANAVAVIHFSTPGYVTGIGNLDIDGTLYNVDFEAVGDVFSTYPGTEHFWTLEADAAAAIDAVNQAMDTVIWNRFNNDCVIQCYGVAFGDNESLWSIYQISLPHWQIWTDLPYEPEAGNIGTAWSVASVPLPAAVYLFLSALTGLVGIKRFARKLLQYE